jgi:protein HOOK3
MLLILVTEQKVITLQEALRRKEAEFQSLEERYKKYIEKAKSVIRTLDPKQNSGSAEVAVLRNQLVEKGKIIEDLEVNSLFLFITFSCLVP